MAERNPQHTADEELAALRRRVAQLEEALRAKAAASDALQSQHVALLRRHSEATSLVAGYGAAMLEASFPAAASVLLELGERLVGATGGYVALFEGELEAVVCVDPGGEQQGGGAPPGPPGRLDRRVRDGGEALVDNGPTVAPGWLLVGEDVRCVLIAPVAGAPAAGAAREPVGVIALWDKPDGFTDIDARAVTALGQVASLALEHQWARDRLERSEQRFRSVVETANDAILTIDSQARIVTWNRAAEQIFGYPVEDAIGIGLPALIPAPYRAMHERSIAATVGGKRPMVPATREVVGLRRDGSIVPLDVSFSSFGTGEGVYFTAIARDVTRRKRTEEQLEAERARLRAILEATMDGVCIVRHDHRLEYMNPALERLLGPSVGRRCHEVFERRDTPCDRCGLEAVLAGRTAVRSFERDGRSYDSIGSPIRDAEGRPAMLAIVHDMTEHLRAEEARRNLEQQLRQAQKMEAVGRLAGGVAHDFNNVLSVILSYAGLIKKALLPLDPLRGDAEEIEAAAARAASLTRQMLALSRREVVNPRPVDPGRVIRELARMLGRMLGEDVKLLVHVAEPVGRVLADPGQLDQVIMNLVVNARDAMPDGGELRIEADDVELDAEQARGYLHVEPGRYVRLVVADTGAGMTPEVQAHLFEPFFTTKRDGRGTGLGLATAYGIVKQAHGHIDVQSRAGEGTRFEILLPRLDGHRSRPEAPEEAAVPAARGTVLVVEDEDSVRRLIRRVLEEAGAEVIDACSGEEALEASEGHRGTIDLLLVDVVLPGMNGRVLAERLAASRPAMRTLYVSGHADDVVSHHLAVGEGVAFLAKPFTEMQLLRRVRELLGGEDEA